MSLSKLDICRRCGAWCCQRFDYSTWFVRYSLWDILRISQRLSMSLDVFVEKFVYLLDQGSYAIPVIRSYSGKCPFLVDSTCSIHEYKPIACRVFPVRPPGCAYDERCPLSLHPELLVEEESLVPQYLYEHLRTEQLLCEYGVRTSRDLLQLLKRLVKS